MPAQFVLVGKADGMDEEVDRAPLLLQFRKGGVNAVEIFYIAIDEDLRAHTFRQWCQALSEGFALIGEGQFRPLAVAAFGHAIGNGAVADQTGDENFLAGEKAHVVVLG